MTGNNRSVELSKKLGMSKDYLCVYKANNKHLKNYDEAYAEVIKRRQEQKEIMNKLNDIYYYLKDTKGLSVSLFGRHLVSINIYSYAHSFGNALNQSFMNRLQLVQRKILDSYIKIIYEFQDWKKEVVNE